MNPTGSFRLKPKAASARRTCVGVAVGLVFLAVAWKNFDTFPSAIGLLLALSCLTYLTFSTKGRIRDFMIVVASLTLGLSALEVIAFAIKPQTLPVVGKGFVTFKQGLGWGPAGPGIYPARKSDPRTGLTIYNVTYTIDSSLLRKTVSIEDGATIAFFGDSFTFGEGVEDDETMPQAFADLVGRSFRILNFGFPGYGPQQVLHMLEAGTFDSILGSDVRLLVLMTAPWHAERCACKPAFVLRGPRYSLKDSHIELAGECSEGVGLIVREWFQNTNLFRLALEPYWQRVDHDDVELYIRIVVAISELAKKKYKARVIVPFIPAGETYLRHSGFSDASIIQRLRSGGAEVIDASLTKERATGALLEIYGDGHPTSFAHAARARLMKEFISKEMPKWVAN
jgi:hypothetical protein